MGVTVREKERMTERERERERERSTGGGKRGRAEEGGGMGECTNTRGIYSSVYIRSIEGTPRESR